MSAEDPVDALMKSAQLSREDAERIVREVVDVFALHEPK